MEEHELAILARIRGEDWTIAAGAPHDESPMTVGTSMPTSPSSGGAGGGGDAGAAGGAAGAGGGAGGGGDPGFLLCCDAEADVAQDDVAREHRHPEVPRADAVRVRAEHVVQHGRELTLEHRASAKNQARPERTADQTPDEPG